jgi:lipoprotein NlpI
MRPGRLLCRAALLITCTGAAVPAAAQTPQALVDKAETAFAEGRFAETVAAFDDLVKLVPDAAPVLWQRGIALYELGRYKECTAQFASFFAVDASDLENASWHFLCAARAGTLEIARLSALKAGPDRRIMRTQIYEMLLGHRTPEDLVELSHTTVGVAQFYAYLYAGLLRDVMGNRAGAIEYLTQAASDTYKDDGGFMNVVARVHLARLRAAEN